MRLIVDNNKEFDSNSYVVLDHDYNAVVVDIGSISVLKSYLNDGIKVKALLITHAHYDHICYIGEFSDLFPDVNIYVSLFTSRSLLDPKLNLSFYRYVPIVFSSPRVLILPINNGHLNIESFNINYFYTPGHNEGSVSFIVRNHIFTGDSYIPHHRVVSKLKSGNKQQALLSLKFIRSVVNEDNVICAGHGPVSHFSANDIDTQISILQNELGLSVQK